MPSLRDEVGRLLRHSAVYGLGGLAARIVQVFLLPIYLAHLGTAGFGAVEVMLSAVVVGAILLRWGMQSAFFRFYFDSEDPAYRVTVVRTAFWFTMGMSTLGLALGQLFAPELAGWLLDDASLTNVVRAAAVWMWADMNYQQMTALFRVEERSSGFLVATLANLTVTVTATVVLVVVLDKGPVGVIVGNFTGTLAVYAVLLVYRRYQLGLEFDRKLLREMNRFGVPLMPSALALWATSFSDRFFITKLASRSDTGIYAAGAKIASVMTLVITAFTLAWPAFAYSLEEGRARRVYSYILTYVVFLTSWLALTLAVLGPWLLAVIAKPAFQSADEVVPWLVFAAVAFAAYTVVLIGVGRSRRTRSNWVITGTAALVSVSLNLILIPDHGIVGAAIAAATAYTVLFLGMAMRAQRLYPVPYQWRRVATIVAVAVSETVMARIVDPPLIGAFALIAAFPLLLVPLGFFMPEERRQLRGLVRFAR